MPRRVAKKAEGQEIDDQRTATPSSTPRKGRKVVKVEETAVVAQATRTSRATKQVYKEESESEEVVESPKKSSAKLKINRVKSKVVVEEKPHPKAAKRKAKAGDEDEDDEGADADEKKVKKKRKTKEEKEAEAMPLAARTAIGTLKHAMHIGAHVSASGGMFACPNLPRNIH